MLNIQFEQVKVENKVVARNIHFELKPKEIFVLTGKNGSGKSTLAKAILGFPSIQVKGKIDLDDENITQQPLYKRVQKGLFISHQSPISIRNVNLRSFLRTIYLQMEYISPKVDLLSFKKLLHNLIQKLQLPENILERDLNVGFSGGEMKKIEFLQLLLLKPKYAILDEIDSGLDSDSIKIIFRLIEQLADEGISIILISHRENISSEIRVNGIYTLKEKKLEHVPLSSK